MNKNKVKGGNDKSRFNDGEMTEVEKLLTDFVMKSSEQIRAFPDDLIEFSSEFESGDNSNDTQEDTNDEEESENCSTPRNPTEENFESALEELHERLTKILGSKPTFFDQEIPKPESSDFKDSTTFLALQHSSASLKIKDNEGSLVCSLCQWMPPKNSCESFLAHCRTPSHRTKLKERFLTKQTRDKKRETELLETDKLGQIKGLKLKSLPEKTLTKSKHSVAKNQNQDQKYNKEQQQILAQQKSKEEKVSVLTEKIKSKTEETKNVKQKNERKTEREMKKKRKSNRTLKISALAEGVSCIQPISENEIICKMCNKLIPTALDFNTLMKNVSQHLQSKGHLKKVLKIEISLHKSLQKTVKKKTKANREKKNSNNKNIK